MNPICSILQLLLLQSDFTDDESSRDLTGIL